MTEAQLQDAVIDAARLLGWRISHFRPARTEHGWRTPVQGHVGFPDLVLLRPPRLLFVELKATRGTPNHDQAVWLNSLDTVPGVETFVWRPADWQLGTVEELLR